MEASAREATRGCTSSRCVRGETARVAFATIAGASGCTAPTAAPSIARTWLRLGPTEDVVVHIDDDGLFGEHEIDVRVVGRQIVHVEMG